MKNLNVGGKLFATFIFGILLCPNCSSQNAIGSKEIIGNWVYSSHIYRTVGRYGPKEVDSIKSSLLCFTENRVYFNDIKFIDTCYYTRLQLNKFFERENKEPNYFQDGPLALKYSREQLSKFIRIDLDSKRNNFGTFYLNRDTLILNTFGGVTLFFIKVHESIIK